eukprot:gnl/TRDRNA2_/TRDRNA2_150652_c1_seq1.p1 gnl/TRDRNA2_/TRDRNA2_150652_c1~~gnl/TRDRNA2_/TRDRNA2_150652_c1_seq1.p1  ORF type:complete len:271 (-),score=63.75 gnl/TRDRNA2_/TRDRNA2_150652_c1_seq1:68-844(-)
MFAEVWESSKDVMVWSLATRIEALLGVDPGAWYGLNEFYAQAPVRERAPELTLERAKEFLQRMRAIVDNPGYQQQLIGVRPEQETRKTITLINNIVLLLVEFEFSGDRAALFQMATAIKPHAQDSEIKALAEQIEKFTLFPTGAVFRIEGAAQAAPAPEPSSSAAAKTEPTPAAEEVTVSIKHAMNNDGAEIVVNVLSTANMKDVKEALAAKVNQPDLAKKARLVTKSGNGFTGLADTQALGKRRSLLLMGVDMPSLP